MTNIFRRFWNWKYDRYIYCSKCGTYMGIYALFRKPKIYTCPNCKKDKILCSQCPYGHFGECGWARCPTKDELKVMTAYFEEK